MDYNEIQNIAFSKLSTELKDNVELCERELLKQQIKADNEKVGILNKNDGITCKICKNKGYVVVPGENGLPTARDCECMKERKKIQQQKESGLGLRFADFTFDNFKVYYDWQKIMLDKAKKYCYNGVKSCKWIYYCGASGSGKTSICHSICNNLIQQGYDVKYYSWRTVINRIKDMSRDSERLSEKETLISRLQCCEILYIDDLFKTLVINGDKQHLTAPDVNITRDILEYRYMNNKPTILSGEYLPSTLIKIDEAFGSRVVEMCKPDYLISLTGTGKNQRLSNI